jgi:dynein heavy chain
MVFVDPEELKWLPYVQTWMNGYADKVKDEIREYLLDLFVKYVDDGLAFIRKKCQQSINQVMVESLFFLF